MGSRGIFGLFLRFGIIAHYLHGAQYPTGEEFLKNVSLWFACPWTLSVYTIQIGSLGMIVCGAILLILGKTYSTGAVGSAHTRPSGSASSVWLESSSLAMLVTSSSMPSGPSSTTS